MAHLQPTMGGVRLSTAGRRSVLVGIAVTLVIVTVVVPRTASMRVVHNVAAAVRGLPARLGLPAVVPAPTHLQRPPSPMFSVDLSRSSFALPFSAQTCVGYRPTHGDNHHIVFVDPGHGGIDGGAGGVSPAGPVDEKTLLLQEAPVVTEALRAQGYTVIVSRLSDTTMAVLPPSMLDPAGGGMTVDGVHADLSARDVCANSAGAEVLVNLHLDSGGGGSEGPMTFYDDARTFTSDNRRLATDIQRGVVTSLIAAGHQVTDNGILSDSEINAPTMSAADAAYGHFLELGPASPGLVDHPSTMPGVIAEVLYISDPGDVAIITSAEGRAAIAAGIVSGLGRYFGGA